MTTFLLFRREPDNANQVAQACERFKIRTGQTPHLIGIRPGTEPPAGAEELTLVEDKACGAHDFWVGVET
jgi:hypothetical protein